MYSTKVIGGALAQPATSLRGAWKYGVFSAIFLSTDMTNLEYQDGGH